MADQELRDALKRFMRDLSAESRSGLTENLEAYSKDVVRGLRKLMAAHPVDPAPVQVQVTDEAIEMLGEALKAHAGIYGVPHHIRRRFLLAALPHLRIVQQGGEQ